MNKEKKVVTVSGESVAISKCRKFDSSWYKIGDISIQFSGDCYLIDKKYYRFETGNVVYNYSKKEYVLKNDFLMKGIVELNGNDYVFGYFEHNPLCPTIMLESGSTHYLINEEIVLNNKNYREELSSGVYYHIKRLRADRFNFIKIPKSEYKTSLPYDSKGITSHFISVYDKYCNPEINSVVKKYSNLFQNFTFGLEFETTKGYLPDRILNKTGLIPLRDGSISGIEYVTIPLTGEKGIQCIIEATKELEKRTEYNDSCSMHLHIGNIPRTKEFILAFFKLTCALQDEIFTMFPLYKKYNFGVKNKNYSKPYPSFELLTQMDSVINRENIDINFNVLFSYLSQGISFTEFNCDLNNVKFHPNDPNGNQKWNIKSRYFIHNLIPLIFGNKQTIEFRIHTPTYDVNKIIPYMIMCSAITSYAIVEEKRILENKGYLRKINLSRVILDYFKYSNIDKEGVLYEAIFSYINSRKDYMFKNNSLGDIIGKESFVQSCKYVDWKGLDLGTNVYKKKSTITPYYSNETKSIEVEKEIQMIADSYKEFIDQASYTTIVNSYLNVEKKTIAESAKEDLSIITQKIKE